MGRDGDRLLAAWCDRQLGAGVEAVIFRAGYFSEVVGVLLGNGSQVVVKIRPAAPRLSPCAQAQAVAFAAGFPVAELLVAPTAYTDGYEASAEVLVQPGGGESTVEASARLLARQVRCAPVLAPDVLAPSPAWVRWDHDEQGLWPEPDDREVDLNSTRIGWLDVAAAAARGALLAHDDALVVGHVDWVPQNVWWGEDGAPLAVHDWDSLAVLPEPAVAGVAAAVYLDNATVDDTALFLESYQAESGRWTPEQLRAAWAAGLWVRLFDAKKDLLAGRDSGLGPQEVQRRLSRARL